MVPDTIYALSSGRPPAAIAVIRISGPLAHAAGRALAGKLPSTREAGVRMLRDPDSGEILDEAMVLRFDGPASATGEDSAELHTHGSRAVVDAVLGALGRIEGLREARPGEFTRRAFENGRIDLIEAEGLADLLEAETEAQRKAALRLAEGDLSRRIARWNDIVVRLSAAAERSIDYAEENDDEDSAWTADSAALANELREWLARPRLEPLRDGLRIVAAGPPNAGKSSLINALARHDRVIVSDVPGTTRDVVEVPVALDGIAMILTDTAGLRGTDDRVESLGIERTRHQLKGADIVLWLGSSDAAPDHPHLIEVQSKCDLVTKGEASDGLRVSAVTGEGLGALEARLVETARLLLPGDDSIALNRRQAELLSQVRDRLMEASCCADVVIAAEQFRSARVALDRLTGRAGVEDLLDALFARFCLGK